MRWKFAIQPLMIAALATGAVLFSACASVQMMPVREEHLLTSPLATPDPFAPTPVPFDPYEKALEITSVLFPSITGTPEVLYSDSVTSADFPLLGLSQRNFNGGEPPLAYVLIRGDFDVSDFKGGMGSGIDRARYIAYVFDMRAMAVTTTAISVDGVAFAGILGELGITPVPATEIAPLPTEEIAP